MPPIFSRYASVFFNLFSKDNYSRHIFLVVGTLILFYVVREYFLFSNSIIGQSTLVSWGSILILSLVGAVFHINHSSQLLRSLIRINMFMVVFYLLTYYVAYPSEMMMAGDKLWFQLEFSRYIAILFGVLAFFRPSLALFPLCYIYWQKQIIINVSQFSISTTDYLTVVEFGLFIVIGFILIQSIEYIRDNKITDIKYYLRKLYAVKPAQQSLKNEFNKGALWGNGSFDIYNTVSYIAISSHFANYLYSGIKKLRIDEDPFAWLFDNPTHYLMLTASKAKTLPVEVNDVSLSYFYPFMESINFSINFLTLFFQLLCVIAIVKVSYTRIIAFIYDLQHIIIFAVTGLFFWKWIWLNSAIIYSLRYLKGVSIPKPIVITSMIVMVISPLFFTTATLGWFDSKAVNNSYFMAVTNSGEKFRIPSNYFLNYSITVAQQEIGRPFVGHFENGLYGVSANRDLMLKANSCRLKTSSESGLGTHYKHKRLDDFIKNHHKYILSRVDENGIFNYELFPHHIWSNFIHFNKFYNLDKREIKSYIFIIDSICLDYKEGMIKEKSVLKGEYEIIF